MNLRVTIEGITYNVHVEVDPANLAKSIDGSATSATSTPRAEGLTLERVPPRTNPRNGLSKPKAPPASTPSTPQPTPSPAPASINPPQPVKPAWHGLGAGESGEVISPIASRIRAVCVTQGQRVKPGDALIELEASATYSPGDKPLQGTLRAAHGGIVERVDVTPQQVVPFKHPLLIIRPDSPA